MQDENLMVWASGGEKKGLSQDKDWGVAQKNPDQDHKGGGRRGGKGW